MNLKNFILDIIFPPFCLGCQKEGNYLCQDCKATLEVLTSHKKYSGKNMEDLYFALPYQGSLLKNLIKKFKHEPFVKELGKALASLIIDHFNLLDNKPDFSDFVLIPVPLEKRKLKWRGFNQAEKIAKELSNSLKIPLVSDVLIRENGVFLCQKPEKIKGKKILLINDFFVTGSTMEECSKVLKGAGAEKITGAAVARE